ncbi:class I SAM-dependent methyltransferase [Demequina sp.]|uniref:class I SAM-dependent methyltransferase n=1 Tax=Demequina sp. TaxID=2050685 RepID=UPI003D11D041
MTTYTHGHHESVLRSHRNRTVENSAPHLLPLLKNTDRLLDVGAGPGTITVDFASRVAHVTATEIGEDEVSLARATAAEHGATNIDFAVADVHRLQFADDSFDVTHAHQVLQHVGDPVQALREMARVTRPGGIVAVRDSDYSAFTWWPQVPELDRWLELYVAVARANGAEPDAGRRLLSWAHAAGLTDVSATSSTWCYATEAEREWWGGLWSERILNSAIAEQLLGSGLATQADLLEISEGWKRWAADGDGWFSVLHGELICYV